jgi:hypothetical protein
LALLARFFFAGEDLGVLVNALRLDPPYLASILEIMSTNPLSLFSLFNSISCSSAFPKLEKKYNPYVTIIIDTYCQSFQPLSSPSHTYSSF